MIGLGLVVVEKFFRRRRRRRHLGVDLKKLGICIKNMEYTHFSSRGCYFWGKKKTPEALLQMTASFFFNRGSFFGGKTTPEALLKMMARF